MVQTAAASRLVVDCRVKPVALMGHDNKTFASALEILSCGGLIDPNARLNNVPLPEVPPVWVVPYRVLPDISKLAKG